MQQAFFDEYQVPNIVINPGEYRDEENTLQPSRNSQSLETMTGELDMSADIDGHRGDHCDCSRVL